MNTSKWGPHKWSILHWIARRVRWQCHRHGSCVRLNRDDIELLMLLSRKVLPCVYCRKGLSWTMSRMLPRFTDMCDLPTWMWRVHHCVNRKLRRSCALPMQECMRAWTRHWCGAGASELTGARARLDTPLWHDLCAFLYCIALNFLPPGTTDRRALHLRVYYTMYLQQLGVVMRALSKGLRRARFLLTPLRDEDLESQERMLTYVHAELTVVHSYLQRYYPNIQPFVFHRREFERCYRVSAH